MTIEVLGRCLTQREQGLRGATVVGRSWCARRTGIVATTQDVVTDLEGYLDGDPSGADAVHRASILVRGLRLSVVLRDRIRACSVHEWWRQRLRPSWGSINSDSSFPPTGDLRFTFVAEKSTLTGDDIAYGTEGLSIRIAFLLGHVRRCISTFIGVHGHSASSVESREHTRTPSLS